MTEVKTKTEAKKEVAEVVVPGEFIGEKAGRKVGSGAYYEGEKVFAEVLGVPRVNEDEIFVISLSGVYMPNIDDKIVGVISGVEISGWSVDINAPYIAFLPLSEGVADFVDTQRTDISRFFDVGDFIFCKISKSTKNKTIQASMRAIGCRKLYNGITIKVTPSKIPRIIGKNGSMISLIKEKTGCDIIAGQNGVVWIRGEDKTKAIEAILTIEKESHTVGLTEKIEKMFK